MKATDITHEALMERGFEADKFNSDYSHQRLDIYLVRYSTSPGSYYSEHLSSGSKLINSLADLDNLIKLFV